ncbi:MAG TPA: hypothetical protein VFE24_18445 [Pirellulales bacterium]|nr:hypothetical protein [Pirellulales bacterium]
MQIDDLRQYLDSASTAHATLRSWGLADLHRAHGNLVRMALSGLTLDLLAALCDQLAVELPKLSDPDMALNNLDRFLESARAPLSLAALLDRDREALPILLQIFSTSQYLSDLLITDRESYDLLRMSEGQPVAREVLVEELRSEVSALPDEHLVLAALRRFKRRETLRIGYGDIVRGQRIDIVTRQISHLADAIVEGAVTAARQALVAKRGQPLTAQQTPAGFVVLAMGKLGGEELNYSSDIDLIFLFECDGVTAGPRSQANAEFFDRMAREVLKLLSQPTELGAAYRVDMRLRPEGAHGPLVMSYDDAIHYYDTSGRTWERQAFVKARPIAGDLPLGRRFLAQLEPWIYRRYLNRADITGIKALKRRIEHRAQLEGADERNVKTGHGGIRDVEFVIQFLQLLNGADLPSLRTGSTLSALAHLEQAGCVTNQERTILEENYSVLRKIEHRLQILFDLQTHVMPTSDEELRKLAIRMGYSAQGERPALGAFLEDYRAKTELNRKILNHLLHDAFKDDNEPEPEVDLVLDPDPSAAHIQEVLARYPFRDVGAAYKNLMALGDERIRFLSARRCRHFLASIAPRLLQAVAATPDPDAALVNLSRVSDSLGGKGVLWELFSFNPPTLKLYVDLCALSSFLSNLLTSNPGMIDELTDSLVLDKLPSREWLAEILAELCRSAEDLAPILNSFKNAQQLRVGVRDILGKDDIQATTDALAAIAETCLRQIAQLEYAKLVAKYGQPQINEGPRAGAPCELIILALGKLGGRELNYHSDLDLVFLFEADGMTFPSRSSRRSAEITSNQHFFGELGQRIIKVMNQLTPDGRLFEIDPRLRPTGKNGPLATSLAEFEKYYASGLGQLWERQALCRARIVYGSSAFAGEALEAIGRAAFSHPWQAADLHTLRQMRLRLEETCGKSNLKRGRGGLVDIEFIVQMLQLQHGAKQPEIREPNTRAALVRLLDAGCIEPDDFHFLNRSYRFLRTIEAKLRLMNSSARDDLPDDPRELDKLAFLSGYQDRGLLLAECQSFTAENRRRFERFFAVEETAATIGD